MPDLIDRLIAFAEHGNQHKITLPDGQTLQGWIMQIDEDGLLISTGYGDKTGVDHQLSLAQLQGAELSYWDSHAQLWQHFEG